MKKILFTLLVIASAASLSFSQGLKFGVGGGLNFVQTDYYKNIGLDNGYHLGIKAKLDIPVIPITPVAHLRYTNFSGNYDFGGYNIETSQSVFSFGVGGEVELVPGPLSPYLAVDLMYNNFGELSYSGPSGSVTPPNQSSKSRMGIAIGAGVSLSVPMLFGVDVSAKYHFMNIIGKDSGEDTIGALELEAMILF